MGKKLPKQHQIDEKACKLFDSALPESWICRPQLKDYGVDREVEIFEKEKSTGIIFKVQVKGTEKPKFSSDGLIIGFSLSMDDVEYLCEELKIPVVLALVDVTTSKIWWHAIQLDSELMKRFVIARQKKQTSITVHLNSENTLPETLTLLMKKILESVTFLSISSLSKASPTTFMNSMASIPDLDKVLKDLGRSAALVKSEKLARLWQSQDIPSIKKHIEEILENKDSSVEVKFEAHLYVEKISLQEARLAGDNREYSKITYGISKQLISISKRGPLNLRLYAALSLAASELYQYTQNDLYLYMNSKVHESTIQKDNLEPVWIMMLPSARKKASVLVDRKYRQCLRLLDFILKNNQFTIFPLSAERVIGSMLLLLVRLREEGMIDVRNTLELALRKMADIAIDIALALKSWDEVSLLVSNSVLMCNIHDDKSIKSYKIWVENKIKKIEDVQIREETRSHTEKLFEKMNYLVVDDNGKDEDLNAEKNIIRGMAQSMGINLDDPDDDIAQIVNIGLTDLDPTRVLKNCNKLYITLASGGLPARVLFLPTAGFKTLYCTLHKYGIASMSLDGAYKSFKEEHCSKCKDKCPHPNKWKWTRPWQQKQHELHKERFKPL